MAEQATNPKIEELRGRVKSDPKSRLFYQLAEELRKVKAYDESEEVLRAGLTHNATYLAAWVSLGRVLREKDKHHESIDAFSKALQLDRGNVVAARLMADAYLDLGDKIEAIKKYKLVRALLPVDEELNAIIDNLEDEINPVTVLEGAVAKPQPPPAPQPPAPSQATAQPAAHVPPAAPPPMAESRGESTQPGRVAAPAVEEAPFAVEPIPLSEPFSDEEPPVVETRDSEPMRVAHDESPFEEPAPAYSSAAVDVEQPPGMHVEEAPPAAEVAAPWAEEDAAADVFAPSEPVRGAVHADDVADTITMADLYVKQGFRDRAQSIYESILDRDPNNDEVRAKLDALGEPVAPEAPPAPLAAAPIEASESESKPKVQKLQSWLAKVKRDEDSRV